MNPEKTGKLITKLRKEKNLTQSQLEEIIKVDRRTISKWENGKMIPDSSILMKLSKTLGITVEELLSGKIENKSNIPKSNHKIAKKIAALILILSLVGVLTGIIMYIHKSNTYKIYTISSELSDFQLDGEIRYKKSECSIRINHLLYTDIYIGTDKEIVTSKVTLSLLENDRVLIAKTFEDKKKNSINFYLENANLEYSDRTENTKIKNPKNLVINITYLDFKNELQYLSIKPVYN